MGGPTRTTLAAFALVFLARTLGGAFGIDPGAFALAAPLGHRPWTIATSVYTHAGLGHLLANAVALAVVGPLVARVSTPIRFHAFVLCTGGLAGIAQVVATAPFGRTAVLGASGAVFALFGYVLIGNRASERFVSWLPLGRRGRLAVLVVLAASLTAATAAPGVALVAHFVGFCLGALAGRGRILHATAEAARR
ncbi:rhomboid family intramembrane serine protease [Natronomonas sp.]|uniref:rhomboid family intramembrane serine protease n=1 Tax=Natronomonas sp. TaxID=2184060 RepID=UPI00260E2FB2|nr:rhomboid family intramembrane serine protease [Natronomonas sp.]